MKETSVGKKEDNTHANYTVSLSSIVRGSNFVIGYEEAKYGFPFNFAIYNKLTQDDQFDYEWGRQLATVNPNLSVCAGVAKRETIKALAFHKIKGDVL